MKNKEDHEKKLKNLVRYLKRNFSNENGDIEIQGFSYEGNIELFDWHVGGSFTNDYMDAKEIHQCSQYAETINQSHQTAYEIYQGFQTAKKIRQNDIPSSIFNKE